MLIQLIVRPPESRSRIRVFLLKVNYKTARVVSFLLYNRLFGQLLEPKCSGTHGALGNLVKIIGDY